MESAASRSSCSWLLVGLVVALLFWPRRGLLVRVIVHDYERGLRFRGASFGAAEPGCLHVPAAARGDPRSRRAADVELMVEGQEVPTKDGVAVKVGLGRPVRHRRCRDGP